MTLVERAQKAGVKNLLFTVDVPVAGARLRDSRNGLTAPAVDRQNHHQRLPRPAWWIDFLTTPGISFASLSSWSGTDSELLDYTFDPTMIFDDLKWIREQWNGTMTLKGIQNLEDTKQAAKLGVDAIILSNHGGRQLDRAPVPLHLLADIEKEFKKGFRDSY